MFLNFLYHLTIIACVSSNALKRKRDIGLQTCIQNFDVHKDKIIRTQDSKEMGAKYINEIDLGSREECLRLCCEIERCDVFVFEEKNSGSCYLFECGPPEDFKCKFTHHDNYSSAILAVNRHLPDLEKQIKLTKHEQDLNKLRAPKEGKVQLQTTEEKTTVSSTTTSDTKSVSVASSSIPSNTENAYETKCSRYQFECRSTKECIAIYNACDGIPQCADGSDEAYELGCPDTTTKSVTQIFQNQRNSIDLDTPTLPKNGLTKGKQLPHPQNYFSSSKQQRQDEFQTSNGQGGDSDFVRPSSRILHPIAYDNPPSHYNQMVKSQVNDWPEHPPADIGQQYEDNNHVYNYKENGIQASEGQERQTHFEDSRKPNYFNGVYQQFPQQYDEKWTSASQDGRFRNRNPYIPDVNQNIRQPWIQQTNIPAVSIHQEHEKMAHELKHSKELMENIPNKIVGTPVKIEKFESHKSSDNIQYAKVTQYKVDPDLEDGIAETPGGAVLSLTLGLIITCIMALLIGCRLRIVRRRIRRGGKSYAHDADYLVNGMYL